MHPSSLSLPSFFSKPGVILKSGKEKPILNRHHWIFSGAIKTLPDFQNGEILPVYSSGGHLLGCGYFNRRSNIMGRMVSFDVSPPLKTLEAKIIESIDLRKNLFDKTNTNAFRLINGEGDGLPGLIVDLYDSTLVVQFSTLGMDLLREWVIAFLDLQLCPSIIFEKSLLPARKAEGLKERQQLFKGSLTNPILIKENGLQFEVQLEKSQKTGFFLDHREMRQWVRSLAFKKRVLNAFSYTGGFTVYSLAGGAETVDSVDISEEAIHLAQKNVSLNGYDPKKNGFFQEDVFQFLRERDLNYELIILDPPAFAKKKQDVIAAGRGYKDINRLAMQKMPAKSLLLTCSCSHHMDEELFQKIIFQAASEAKREVRIIGRHRLAQDHPINIFHPETEYLKSLLLFIK